MGLDEAASRAQRAYDAGGGHLRRRRERVLGGDGPPDDRAAAACARRACSRSPVRERRVGACGGAGGRAPGPRRRGDLAEGLLELARAKASRESLVNLELVRADMRATGFGDGRVRRGRVRVRHLLRSRPRAADARALANGRSGRRPRRDHVGARRARARRRNVLGGRRPGAAGARPQVQPVWTSSWSRRSSWGSTSAAASTGRLPSSWTRTTGCVAPRTGGTSSWAPASAERSSNWRLDVRRRVRERNLAAVEGVQSVRTAAIYGLAVKR
jgi:hypothetical protein